jgi:S-(hydroxymethyl)glutathione dehydrogenase/alcohol dehydrogenase
MLRSKSIELEVSVRGVIWDGDAVKYVEGIDVRAPGDDEVLVAVRAAGVCQSDLSCTTGRFDVRVPMVMGHEAAGVIVEVGAHAGLAVGEHVVLTTLGQCGRCRACASGFPTRCPATLAHHSQPFRYEGRPTSNFAGVSAFTERVVVKASQAIPIPRSVPFETAAIVGCAVLTGAGAVWNTAGARRGETVAVVGLGGVGLSAVQAAEVAGATEIVALDTNPQKAEIAAAAGASHFIALDGACGDAIRTALPDGADAVIVCVGNTSVMASAVDGLAWGGRCVLVASPQPRQKLELDVNALIYVDRMVMGSRYGCARPSVDIPYIFELHRQGRFALDALITNRAPLQDAVAQLDLLAGGVEGRIVLEIP